MDNYVEVLKIALMFFPFIALIISIPFILIEYHKFGSLSFVKGLIIYSFVLYFICAYFLIILPLPNKEEVRMLTTPRVQLIPFNFIVDFIKNTSFNITIPSTYIKTITESYFYVPIYNLLLTLPFGMYLRYYYEYNLKKIVKYTFLLSLFFELTQLSGLYFIYARGYRLFDVDDLILNTIGGILGYLLFKSIEKRIPSIKKVESIAKEKGKRISGFKRFTAFTLDLFLYSFFTSILSAFIDSKYFSIIVFLVYYIVIPYLRKGSTIGEKFINLRIIDYKDKNNIIRLFIRKILFIIIYIAIPFALFYIVANTYNLDVSRVIRAILFLVPVGIVFLIYSISGIKYVFTNKPMLYEKISKTKMISTIK